MNNLNFNPDDGHFKEDYGEDCSIQYSSSIEPHIWLGIHKPKPLIMCSDAQKLGLPLPKDCEYYNGKPAGWCDYEVPKEVFINGRMHLTPKQALSLGLKLIKYGIFKRL